MINKIFISKSWRPITLILGLICALSSFSAETTFLKADEAYRSETTADGHEVAVTYHIRDGYYLYRKRFGFSTDTPGVTLDPAVFPAGLSHSDEYFGEQEIYRGTFTVRVPYHRSNPATTSLQLKLRLQGCADAGLCYPPQTWVSAVPLPAAAAPKPAPSANASGGLLNKLIKSSTPTQSDAEFLPAEKAFRPSAGLEREQLMVHVAIAPGYYLYRDRIHLTVAAPTTAGNPIWPAGEIHHDEYFGDQTIFRGDLQFQVPFQGPHPTQLKITYQGCADAGLCYTPQTRLLTVETSQAPSTAPSDAASSSSAGAEQDRLANLVRSGQWWAVLGAFWFFGLLLAFTPCVLPMVPILAGIIAGDGEKTSAGRSFALSLAYVGGMAITYTSVGVAFAAAGAQAQAVFQQPWILVLFAALFVALAFAMFGFYELALPSGLQTRFATASNQIKGGRMISSAVMGALSSLIVTACVAPPLVATFIVIGQAGAIGRGALALGALSLGMGTPLLLVGASAGRLLPKSGPWMETVKALFGVVFLGVAVWMLDRLVGPRITMTGWGVVAASAAWVVARVGRRPTGGITTRSALALVIILYALALILSASLGGTDPLRPLSGTRFGQSVPHALEFRRIKTSAELDRVLAEAQAAGKPTLLDFSADWCVSCKEMDAHTFNVARVQAVLAHYLVLRADVTANDADDQALLHRFGIFGPPTTAFFKADGAERRQFRLVGFVDADHFLQHLSDFEAAP